MENLTCELNGIKYVLIENVAHEGNMQKIEKSVKKYGCITQSISQIHKGGIFTNSYCIVKILVPENKILDWENSF